jgi:hypothetical protein
LNHARSEISFYLRILGRASVGIFGSSSGDFNEWSAADVVRVKLVIREFKEGRGGDTVSH